MLRMIFQNEDLMSEYTHYYDKDYSIYKFENDNQNQNHKVIKNNYYNPLVEIMNDDEWGFYVEIDPSTPPKQVFPKKNNTHKHLANSYYHYKTTQQKNVNYLPQIQEEQHDDQFILDMDLPNDMYNDNDDYKENITQNIFSGLTICALTTASIYFYNKIRSS
uniref:Uncharacterized protein n=1 Tax=viral metagenome TaxID=1070528 RepID=A0A6C0BXF0_9ZZZZ